MQAGAVDRLLIECPHESHPAPLALLLKGVSGDQDNEDDATFSGARLSSVVLAIDAALVSNLIAPEGSGSESLLLICEQIEFADNIVLTGSDERGNGETARQLIAGLNPRARIFQQPNGSIADDLLAVSTAFSYEAAFGDGWAAEGVPSEVAIGTTAHIRSFRYESRRPFHPTRFWRLLHRRLPGIFRVKGLFWIATRMKLAGGINLAANEGHCGGAGEWQAGLAKLPSSQHPGTAHPQWREGYGDRRQVLNFLGTDFDDRALCAELDRSLLDDQEMSGGEEAWARLPDPFPSWTTHAHDHHREHHGCSGH